jgi:hypothetical protein
MPLIEQEVLGPLLRQTAASFDVPETGIADTLLRVRQGDDERAARRRAIASADRSPVDDRRAPAFRRLIRSHRPLTAAAAVVVLVVVIGGVVGWGPASSPPLRSATRSSAAPTAPRHGGGHVTPPFSATTPSPAKTSAGLPAGLPYGTITGAGSAAATGTSAPTFSAAGSANAALGNALEAQGAAASVRIEESGSLTLRVAHGAFAPTMAKLASLATANGGAVAGSQTQADARSADGAVTVRIPVASFSTLVNADQALGQASALVTRATDVTARYTDLENRIGQLQASRQQYQDIKAELYATGSVLSVQAKLDDLGGQIDHLQNQLAALTAKTTYATLTVTLKELGS